MDLPRDLQDAFLVNMARFEEEKRMPFVSPSERIWEERGLQRGRQEALLEGIEQVLEVKYGADGLQLLPEIRQIQDLAILQAVLHAVKSAAQPDELRRFWAK